MHANEIRCPARVGVAGRSRPPVRAGMMRRSHGRIIPDAAGLSKLCRRTPRNETRSADDRIVLPVRPGAWHAPAMAKRMLSLGHSPDPDDAFMFYALAKQLVPTHGFRFEHILQ